jgi:D-alanyl-D-alanine-carboxypeptidase/D-alanyl-D-alanine-endopeptidase
MTRTTTQATVALGLLLLPMSILSAKPPADLQRQLDDFVKGGPGGAAVAWVDADGTAFFQSGTVSAAEPQAITADTPFELGSLSKIFTSLLLAESERLGKVSRLDPAAKYLLPADDPAQASLAKITLLSLSTHTSGLPRLPSNLRPADVSSQDPYAAYDRARLVEALRRDGPGAPTGRGMAYSNFGAAVLGEALGAAWGGSYTAALGAHVLAPLGLQATTTGLAGVPPPDGLAPGHVGGKPVPNWTALAFAPAGGLRSSARDMARFLAACLGDSPLRASIDATLQPEFPAPDTGGQIGLGWMLADDGKVAVAWHNGATAGSHAFMAFNRRAGAGVVILANFQKGSEALGFGLLGTKQPQPKPEAVPDASGYVGRYPLSPVFAIDVTEGEGRLRLQCTGQPMLGLRPISPDRFAVGGVPAEVSFERDAQGKVTALVLHQNGRDLRGPRGELPPAPTEMALPVEVLRQYVGSYPLTPGFVIEVTEEGGALFAQATAQPKLPVFASAKDEFFYKIVNARLSFYRESSGMVIGLILHQNGRDLNAKKT